ncbi:hypothetical protein SLE2022_017300 [Rubroshorea leprosula]
MEKSKKGFVRLLICSISLSFISRAAALDTITPGQSMGDGETLVSSDGSFELGFFRPGNSKSLYLGIWYKQVANGTVVWVANRENPISDGEGVLVLDSKGTLILNSTRGVIWSSNTSRTAENPVAQLFNSGNLVVKDGNDDNNTGNNLWQSFDYPSDTLLPGMKLGKNLKTGFDRFLSSWRSTDDPAPGQYSVHIDPQGFPQLVLKRGTQIQYRGGSWNGIHFSGSPYVKLSPRFTYVFVFNDEEVYFEFEVKDSSVVSRYVLNPSGLAQGLLWKDEVHDWGLAMMSKSDVCENYAFCGTFATCNVNSSPECSCLEGFLPKSLLDWNSGVWSSGCVRETPLHCNEDGFFKLTRLKLPDTSNATANMTMNLKECEEMCLKNCSCKAYANADIRNGGSGCLLWFDDLIDIIDLPDAGQDLYIRLAASEIARLMQRKNSREKKHAIIIASSVIIGAVLLLLGILLYLRTIKLRREGLKQMRLRKDYMNDGEKEEMELQMFDLTTIASATSNFSSNNKLGEGGFGPVYKGKLLEGKDIAVKRLSRNSGQGLQEFKNEVILIARLQHRNLVKLLGCCIEGDERMLIYEFMPNKSLDYFIFDRTRSKLLDWEKRTHIISGIARGLLYLHQDSRLRIIHRDLKAANVLLDSEMNPKISDFGMARSFWGEQTEANTRKVVGTYGYMSPEYVVDGLFSVKSDVFSFGVLVLEVVTGKKNRGFWHPDHDHNLLGHAWRLWIEGRPMELIDSVLGDFCAPSEVLRCIHVGLLCVQHRPEDRPNMATVVLMLGGESALPQPKQPGFFTERSLPEADSAGSQHGSSSKNECTITLLEAR